MSIFDRVEVRWLKRELSKPIDVRELSKLESSLIAARAQDVANKIYSRESALRPRPYQTVLSCCQLGELGEVAIAHRLRQAGMIVVENREEITGNKYWDLTVENLKLEVKHQAEEDEGGQRRTFISFSSEEKIETARANRNFWDLMVCWRKIDNLVYPWYLTTTDAWGERFSQRSHYNTGYFIKMTMALNAREIVQLCKM